jgi:hypothetical protein
LSLLQQTPLAIGDQDGRRNKANVLKLLLSYAPLLTPIATCLPATLISQIFAPGDLVTSQLFMAYWIVPPALVTIVRVFFWIPAAIKGEVESNAAVESVSYFTFLSSYITLLILLLLRVVAVNNWEDYLNNVWRCNVV